MKKRPIFVGFAIIAILILWGLAYGLYLNFGAISLQEAQKICDDHAQKASVQISQLKGYVINESSTQCLPRYSELGSDGYSTGSSFLIAKQEADNQKPDVTKSDTERLKSELRVIQEGWEARNIFDANGRNNLICVTTSAYFKKDGKYDKPGKIRNSASFYAATTELGYSGSCLEKNIQKSLL